MNNPYQFNIVFFCFSFQQSVQNVRLKLVARKMQYYSAIDQNKTDLNLEVINDLDEKYWKQKKYQFIYQTTN